MEQRKQFTFYRSFYDAVNKLEPMDRLGLLEAIIGFALDGVEPKGLPMVQDLAFGLIRPNLEASAKKARAGSLGAAKSSVSKSKKKKEKEKEEETEIELEIEKELEIELEDECPAGEGFTEFWEKYPVKIGKREAVTAWRAYVEDPAAVMKGLSKWLWSRQWQRENGRFVPRPDKFLADGYYTQDPPGEVPKGGTGELGKAELEAIAAVMKEGAGGGDG